MKSGTLNKSEGNLEIKTRLAEKIRKNNVIMIDYDNDFDISVSRVNFNTAKTS